jgi:hypothetical protein
MANQQHHCKTGFSKVGKAACVVPLILAVVVQTTGSAAHGQEVSETARGLRVACLRFQASVGEGFEAADKIVSSVSSLGIGFGIYEKALSTVPQPTLANEVAAIDELKKFVRFVRAEVGGAQRLLKVKKTRASGTQKLQLLASTANRLGQSVDASLTAALLPSCPIALFLGVSWMVEPVTTTTIRVGPPITTSAQSEAVTSQGSQPIPSANGRPEVPMYFFPQVSGFGYVDKRTYSILADTLYEQFASTYAGVTVREIADYPPKRSYGLVAAFIFRADLPATQRAAGLEQLPSSGLVETTSVNGFRIFVGSSQGYEKILASRNEIILEFTGAGGVGKTVLAEYVNKMLTLHGPA